MAALCRFDQLRIKTDQQLLQLVNDALDVGICEARQALRSSATRAFAEQHYLKAKKAYDEASRLIPLVAEISEHERNQRQAGREHLKGMLEGLSVLHGKSTGKNIPTLARALWRARGCPVGSPEDDWFLAEQALESHFVYVRS